MDQANIQKTITYNSNVNSKSKGFIHKYCHVHRYLEKVFPITLKSIRKYSSQT